MLSLIFGFIFGTILGSFADVLATRSLKKRSIWGRSYCLNCKKQIRWYDLFPILSYLLLKGHCRFCHKKFSSEHLWVEIAMGVLSALIFWTTVPDLSIFTLLTPLNLYHLAELAFKLFAAVVVVAVFVTDLKTGLIPNRITYPTIIISAVVQVLLAIFKSWYYYSQFIITPLAKYLMPPYSDYFYRHMLYQWQDAGMAFLAALVLSGSFIALIIGTRGRGMGWGDVKYVAFLGLALGFSNSLLAVFLAFLIGAVFSVLLLVGHRKHFGQTIPFGPFLSLGAAIALIWGAPIIHWYTSLAY